MTNPLTTMRGLPCGVWAAFAAMVAVVTVSNVAVQVPINAWLTQGNFGQGVITLGVKIARYSMT